MLNVILSFFKHKISIEIMLLTTVFLTTLNSWIEKYIFFPTLSIWILIAVLFIDLLSAAKKMDFYYAAFDTIANIRIANGAIKTQVKNCTTKEELDLIRIENNL